MRLIVSAALLMALLLVLAGRAAAVEYELPLDIETEEDLYDLLASEEITEETFDTLVELLRKGVDLDKAAAEEIYALPGLTMQDAEAIVAYRVAAGGIGDPGGLVAGGALDGDKLATIAPFLLVSRPRAPGITFSGRARYRALVTSGDGRVPSMAAEARVTTLRNVTASASVILTRNNIGDVRYDPTRDALSGDPRATRPRLAKLYLHWSSPKLEVIAGSFQAGFGQALTFDNSPVYLPSGIYRDDAVYRSTGLVSGCIESSGELDQTPCPSDRRGYVSPDFRFSPSLFGLGVRAKKLAIGASFVELTGFVSRQVRDIYQYEIYDRGVCADPTDDDDDACGAPAVFRRGDDLLEPTSQFRFATLPSMWAELLGGANASLYTSRRSHVGVTGWGAKPTWLTDGIDLDFQEWSVFPRGGAYGAVGADAAIGWSWLDAGVEVTRTFDQVDGGGLGVLARGTASWKRSELELSARFYDEHFANPHTGAIADADEVDGVRARDEAGVRLRYAGKPSKRLSLRGLVDLWRQPSADINKIRAEARADYLFLRQLTGGVYARWSDKDLAEGGGTQCYETSFEETVDGEPIPCRGQKLDLGLLATLKPWKRLTLGLQGQLRRVDDEDIMDGVRQDVAAIVKLNWWPTSELRVSARARYDRPDFVAALPERTYQEHTLWTYLQVSYRLPRSFLLGARYELRAYLDEELRSYIRTPSPEHWFQLEIEAKY